MTQKYFSHSIIPPNSEEILRPLWSVMIPVCNSRHLSKTLSSVLAQDPGSDMMQIEVLDNCSTQDDLELVVEELGGRVAFYRQQENVGKTKFFEACLKRSQGHLIHLLPGDDFVSDGFYLKMQQVFDQHPEIGAAFCRHIESENDHQQNISELEQPESGVMSNCLERLAAKNLIYPCSIVVRRSIYEKLGGFNPQLSYHADWEMWVRIAAYCPIWYEVEPLAVHSVHSTFHTVYNVRTGENLRDARRAIEIFQSYLPRATAHNLSDRARENCALNAIQKTIPQLFAEKDKAAVFAQMREALKCSHSFRVLLSVILLTRYGLAWLWQKVQTGKFTSLFPKPLGILMEFYIRPFILQYNVKHISGLKEINYATNELIVLCLVRNGELYVKSFIEHYLALGVKHIVLLDNDSTDDTIAIASNYENTTILQTKCPFKRYETVMRRYLVRRFSPNRWNLFSDIDELFDYPFSNVLSIDMLLTYLNERGYTAAVAQMLDLFSDTSLANLKSHKDDSIKDIYTYYDISNIQKFNYNHEFVPDREIKHHWGGIRHTLFGSNNYLTKVPLTFLDKRIKTFVAHHHVKNASIADFTCVLLHYPFLSFFYDKVVDAVKTDRYKITASDEYRMYWEKLQQDPDLHLKQETACKLEDVNALLESNFLVVSDDYLRWVRSVKNLE